MRNFLSRLILLVSLPSFVFAQEINWQRVIGGTGSDETTQVIRTTDGGFLIACGSNSNMSADKSEDCIGGGDYWIIKTNSTGTILWENTIGGIDLDGVTDVLQTADGGYLLAGISQSDISGDKTQNSKGLYDYWIVKIDSAGIIQWQNTIGGDDNDILEVALITSDGGYLLAGSSQSDISGDKSENTLGFIDYWIVKTDGLGNVLWENTIRGNDYDALRTAKNTPDGGFLLGGFSNSYISGDKNEHCINGSTDYWIVKTDSLGSILWQNTIGGDSGDKLESIVASGDGGFILGGYSDSGISGDKTTTNFGGNDYWVIKTDSIGNILWQTSYGGSLDDQLKVIIPAAEGGYLLVGNSNSPVSGSKTENMFGINDIWIIKIDSIGTALWQNSIGASELDVTFCGVKSVDDGFLLGALSDSDIGGDKTENSLGGRDIWLLKISGEINQLKGNVFSDSNADGIQNSGEIPITSMKISEANSNRFAFTQTDGSYSLFLTDTGNYEIAPNYLLPYHNISPLNYSGSFGMLQQSDSLKDFAFQTAGNFNDMCVSITPLSGFRSGFSTGYHINYSNQGSTTLNGTIIFYPDINISYTGSNVNPVSIATDSIVFDIGTLLPFQTGNFYVSVNVNLGIAVGTVIESRIEILPLAGDVNPGCNTAISQDYTIASFDPNDILVNRAFLLNSELSTNPELEYTIRFQNTGNDTAFTVKILNTIDAQKVQLNSIEIMNASHPVNVNYIVHERNLEFIFNNILLPDSGTNEIQSHGFIKYKILPKSSLILGDTVFSTAAIYFDYNAPVITNTATTAIVALTGIAESNFNDLQVYPNPVSETLIIETEIADHESLKIELYDSMGKLIKIYSFNGHENNHQTIEINTSLLSKGLYFIRIPGKKSGIKRFIKI